MLEGWEYGQLSGQLEIEELGRILDQCFIGFSGQGKKYVHRVGEENCRVLRLGKQVLGGLVILPLGQWWGGRCVEMGGIAAVGIAPEFRGVGAAKILMQQAIRDMYTSSLAISTLFPATQYLYRQVGYENAMVVCKWEIDCHKINVREQPLAAVPVRIGDSGNFQIFQGLYDQQASMINGYLRRDRFLWGEKFRRENEIIYKYLFGDIQQPQGYIIYNHESSSGDNILRVRDWVLLTPDAITSFWGFLAKMRSQIDKIIWRDAVITPLTLFLPEQNERLRDPSQVMMRIVNVVKALEQRGYSSELATELHLQIKDDLIRENNGNFILKITAGRGTIEPGGKGDFQLDIRALAALYTGLFTPTQLQIAGKLTATQESLVKATGIFANPLPTISDYF